MYKPIFLGSSRCFHTIDWYKSAQKKYGAKILYVTDMIEGEGLPCLVEDRSCLRLLIVIDRWLPNSLSPIGHAIRNFLKLALSPIQALLVRKIIGTSSSNLTFAHSTYYAFLAGLAGINYVSTPQGSEVLVRMEKSILYRCIARIAHRRAILVTVDSSAMQAKLKDMLGVEAKVIQNGVDILSIIKLKDKLFIPSSSERNSILSIRGMTENYQILEIINARNTSKTKPGLRFCCPFFDDYYKEAVEGKISIASDTMLGRLDKDDFYTALMTAEIVISVPVSDSSPRSVYEAIFFGCIVIVRENPFIHDLPKGMCDRIVLTTCEDDWFEKAIEQARLKVQVHYEPSVEDLQLFDQSLSVHRVINELQ